MLKAVGHRILIKTREVEETTSSGIITMYSERQKKLEEAAMQEGVVTDIGPTAYKHPSFGGESWVNVGDTIIFAKYGGHSVIDPEDDVRYVVINDEDVLVKTN